MELPTFLRELLLSHVLLFGRSPRPKKIMDKEFAGIDMDIVNDYRDRWSGGIESVDISDFPIYGKRLQMVHQRMTDWRALSFRGLFRRHYRDLTPYYGFILAMTLGLFGVVGLGWNVFVQFVNW